MITLKLSLSDDCTPERIDYWKQYISFVWGADGQVDCCTVVRNVEFLLNCLPALNWFIDVVMYAWKVGVV